MKDKINKNELIDIVCEEAHVSKQDARSVLDTTLNLIVKSLLEGQEVNIKNFGVFAPKTRKSREGTHPSKHNAILIPARKTIFFRVSKELKEKLNS